MPIFSFHKRFTYHMIRALCSASLLGSLFWLATRCPELNSPLVFCFLLLRSWSSHLSILINAARAVSAADIHEAFTYQLVRRRNRRERSAGER